MDMQKIMPQQAQPISRISSGQLPSELLELTEEVLSHGAGLDSASVLPSIPLGPISILCSYDAGDDAE